jgi:hypothetical protein
LIVPLKKAFLKLTHLDVSVLRRFRFVSDKFHPLQSKVAIDCGPQMMADDDKEAIKVTTKAKAVQQLSGQSTVTGHHQRSKCKAVPDATGLSPKAEPKGQRCRVKGW